jgi:hypothetical protein
VGDVLLDGGALAALVASFLAVVENGSILATCKSLERSAGLDAAWVDKYRQLNTLSGGGKVDKHGLEPWIPGPENPATGMEFLDQGWGRPVSRFHSQKDGLLVLQHLHYAPGIVATGKARDRDHYGPGLRRLFTCPGPGEYIDFEPPHKCAKVRIEDCWRNNKRYLLVGNFF